MTRVGVREAKAKFSQLLRRVERGEQIVITRDGEPVARLVPHASARRRRKPGAYRGRIWVSEDFNAPLPDDLLDAFEGRE